MAPGDTGQRWAAFCHFVLSAKTRRGTPVDVDRHQASALLVNHRGCRFSIWWMHVHVCCLNIFYLRASSGPLFWGFCCFVFFCPPDCGRIIGNRSWWGWWQWWCVCARAKRSKLLGPFSEAPTGSHIRALQGPNYRQLTKLEIGSRGSLTGSGGHTHAHTHLHSLFGGWSAEDKRQFLIIAAALFGGVCRKKLTEL